MVQRPPMFTVLPQHLYMRKLGETLEIPCDAQDGDERHRPTIVWFKVARRILCNSQTVTDFNLYTLVPNVAR